VGDSGDLLAAAGPSPPTAHSASGNPGESFASTVTTQMDSPVSSPSPLAAREAERNKGKENAYRKPLSEMTYRPLKLFGGTLNPAQPQPYLYS